MLLWRLPKRYAGFAVYALNVFNNDITTAYYGVKARHIPESDKIYILFVQRKYLNKCMSLCMMMMRIIFIYVWLCMRESHISTHDLRQRKKTKITASRRRVKTAISHAIPAFFYEPNCGLGVTMCLCTNTHICLNKYLIKKSNTHTQRGHRQSSLAPHNSSL